MSSRWITVAGRHILVRNKIPEDYNDPDEEYLDKWDKDARGLTGGSGKDDDKIETVDIKKLNAIFNKSFEDEDLRHLVNTIEIELRKNISDGDKKKLKELLRQVKNQQRKY